jgi:hypothetical protein
MWKSCDQIFVVPRTTELFKQLIQLFLSQQRKMHLKDTWKLAMVSSKRTRKSKLRLWAVITNSYNPTDVEFNSSSSKRFAAEKVKGQLSNRLEKKCFDWHLNYSKQEWIRQDWTRSTSEKSPPFCQCPTKKEHKSRKTYFYRNEISVQERMSQRKGKRPRILRRNNGDVRTRRRRIQELEREFSNSPCHKGKPTGRRQGTTMIQRKIPPFPTSSNETRRPTKQTATPINNTILVYLYPHGQTKVQSSSLARPGCRPETSILAGRWRRKLGGNQSLIASFPARASLSLSLSL